MHTLSSDGDHGSYHELAGAPVPNPRPLTEGDYSPYHELAGAPVPNPKPSTEGDYGPYHKLAGAPAFEPKVVERPGLLRLEPDKFGGTKHPKLESSKEFSQTDEDQPVNPRTFEPRASAKRETSLRAA
jgi:hypothetical protein